MQFLLVFVALLTLNSASGEDADIRWRIQDDLESLNATCPPYDTCQAPRISDSLTDVACQCTAVCVQLGTCCLDSPYRNVEQPEIRPTCRPVSSDKAYLMVDRCPTSSAWHRMCEEEWAGDSDVLKIVPVTSLFTLITYKNYFCFRCHETTDNFLYWQVELGSSSHEFDPSIDRSSVSPTYFERYRTWAAPLGVGGIMVPVQFDIRIPTEIWPLPIVCERNLISHCADTWNDKDVIDKCGAYTAIVSIGQNSTVLMYRNVHCAICNYEDLSNMFCKTRAVGFGSKMPFSFTHLLDVNRSDGDKVGKIQKCEGDSLWDPYAKKCRNLACALPGHVVKEGKCTPP